MKIRDAVGPGVDEQIQEALANWGISDLTDIQCKALESGIANGRSMVVTAPTSSGKTLVGELALFVALKNNLRAIYLVSHKALADQKYLDFVARFGEKASAPLASVGLSTGDRDEGDMDARLLVATYEKALGLLLNGQLNPTGTIVVADELQIIGDPGRGPDIEALCAVLRQRGVKQFVALTATVENGQDIAAWMTCDLVRSAQRDVPLHQEIWHSGKALRTTFGYEEIQETKLGPLPAAGDVLGAVKKLLDLGRGPVLVFTESRKEAANFANAFGRTRPRAGEGIALAEQLDLFSEQTESSDSLKVNAEKRVAFHTADLSAQERQVIEAGFAASQFEVCFATSTLAAGVNFPFRSIVFAKLTYQYGARAGTHIVRADYRNMSGRAGRLGMHPEGFAILLPRNHVELAHSATLVLPENDRLASQLVNLGLRKAVLSLVASGLISSNDDLMNFFRNTLYWFQTLDRNPSLLVVLEKRSKSAIEWLIEHALLNGTAESLTITPLGKAGAMSGLFPTTIVHFGQLLSKLSHELEMTFEKIAYGLVYAACASDEFCGKRPSRFLPYPNSISYDSLAYWASKSLPVPLDRGNVQLAQCAHAMTLYLEGQAERKISFATKLSSGYVHRSALDVAWVLDGLHKISCAPEVGCSQRASNNISLLARSVRWGAPAEALDVLRIAERHRVPGFGRQGAMALVAQGIATLHDVLTTAKDKLVGLLRHDRRAQALIDAAASTIGHGPSRFLVVHERVATKLGIDGIVKACNEKLGVEYEQAIASLLRIEAAWIVTILDDGIRQNVPDILIQLGGLGVLLECKTCTKSPPLIKKEEAFSVLQKGADFDKAMRRVTLGKPSFDETSKKKAAAAHDITLIDHVVFMEAILRVHTGALSPQDFLRWLGTPGVAELDRVGGKSTIHLT